jgi:hypothetical protein
MLRFTLGVAVLFTAALAQAGDKGPIPDGTWLLTTGGPVGDAPVCLLKTETKDGKTSVSVVDTLPSVSATVSEVKTTGGRLSFKLTETRTFKTAAGERKFSTQRAFVAAPGKDFKELRGSLETNQTMTRSRLIATDNAKLDSQLIRNPASATMQKAQQLASRPSLLRFQAAREKDVDKKKELTEQFGQAQKEADEKLPGLYREVVEKQANVPAAIDAAQLLLQSAEKFKLDPAQANKLLELIDKQAAPYGPKYARYVNLNAAEALTRQTSLVPVSVPTFRRLAEGLTDSDPAATQVRILTGYKRALGSKGKPPEMEAVESRLAKLEAKLDEEYLATVPPFKPSVYSGRKEKGANRVAVLELFTGAQCPPCVAADVAFDALGKSYRPAELVLIQYHMHIPGPDPMTNPDCIARWDYYRKTFPSGIRGTPSTVFNGKPQAGGGGAMANAENKFRQYRAIIDPILEENTPVKVGGKATRSGDGLEITVEVDGAEGELKLRLLVVEETVRYVGGNRLRFHHHVVRAIPGGPEGVAIKEKSFRHTATADVAAVRKELVKYLDDYAANTRPFPSQARPLDMKKLKVIALVQNDTTREIVQAAQIAVE